MLFMPVIVLLFAYLNIYTFPQPLVHYYAEQVVLQTHCQSDSELEECNHWIILKIC